LWDVTAGRLINVTSVSKERIGFILSVKQWHNFFFISITSDSLVHDPLIGELITAVSSNGALLKLVQQHTVYY
jgi:hypothetical protein